jgi:magnesium-protoporphyrin IX monomethyl ester (oxidative) cyclase
VLYRKHLNWWTAPQVARAIASQLIRGQTNFVRGIMNYNRVYNPQNLLSDHAKPVDYEIPLPVKPAVAGAADSKALYVHAPQGTRRRAEDLVDLTKVR